MSELSKQYWLLNPGPVNTSETVRSAAVSVDLCHREPEYFALMRQVRQKLLDVAQVRHGEYDPVLIAGSGTAAMELGIASIVRQGKKLLVINNGVYGARIAKMAASHGIAYQEVVAAWHQRPDLAEVEARLKTDDSFDAVALVHHETTTGLLNPVEAIGRLCRQHGKLFFLDSVSGFGGEELQLADCGVDVMASTANKCLHGLPGVAFVLMSEKARLHVNEAPVRSVYFDLGNYLEQQEADAIPFTPCVPAVLALNQALDELQAQGGISQRIAEYKGRSDYLREQFQALGISLYLDKSLLSNSITAFRLPKNLSYAQIHHVLKQAGYVIYAGQGKLQEEVFRIANMGNVPMAAYQELVACMRTMLRDDASVVTI